MLCKVYSEKSKKYKVKSIERRQDVLGGYLNLSTPPILLMLPNFILYAVYILLKLPNTPDPECPSELEIPVWCTGIKYK